MPDHLDRAVHTGDEHHISHYSDPLAVGLLVAAGLGEHDRDLGGWIEVGRERAGAPTHRTPHRS